MAKKKTAKRAPPKRASKPKRKRARETAREPEQDQDPITVVASVIDRLGDELLDGIVKIAGDLDELAKALRI